MKKSLIYFLIIWLLVVVAYNAIFFISGMNSGLGFYWPAYVACSIALLCQLICGIVAFSQKGQKETILHLPMMTSAYAGLTATFAIASYYSYNRLLPSWIGIIALILTVLVPLINVIGSKANADYVISKENQINTDTRFIKKMSSKLKILYENASDSEIKKELYNALETIKYASLRSVPESLIFENQIEENVSELTNIANSNDVDGLKKAVKNLSKLISEREETIKSIK